MSDDEKARLVDEIQRARRRIQQGNPVAADDALVRALHLLGVEADYTK
jgi:hypothetical protein